MSRAKDTQTVMDVFRENTGRVAVSNVERVVWVENVSSLREIVRVRTFTQEKNVMNVSLEDTEVTVHRNATKDV